MKALLICPDPSPAVALLAETCPLAVAPLLGKSLVEFWIEHLVTLGAREIVIAAADRPAQVAAVVGQGARWGLAITVRPDGENLAGPHPAKPGDMSPVAPPTFVTRMDHLPGHPAFPLFTSYGSWFAALQNWMPQAQALERIGQHEVQPGVWVGLRPRIDASVRLLAPCWIGDYVAIDGGAVIGPGTILEEGVVVAARAHVTRSVIGPATFVGTQTHIENSIAHGSTLINWASNSRLEVTDGFWLSSLRGPPRPSRPKLSSRPMTTVTDGHTLRVSAPAEISTANAARIRERIHAALSSPITAIEVDLAATRFIDSGGLAALCGLHHCAHDRGIRLHLIHPPPSVRQLLELTRMNQFFAVAASGVPAPALPPPAFNAFHPTPTPRFGSAA